MSETVLEFGSSLVNKAALFRTALLARGWKKSPKHCLLILPWSAYCRWQVSHTITYGDLVHLWCMECMCTLLDLIESI